MKEKYRDGNFCLFSFLGLLWEAKGSGTNQDQEGKREIH